MQRHRFHIAALWYCWSGVLALFLLLRLGQQNLSDLLQWLLPNLLPTLTLVGAVALVAPSPASAAVPADKEALKFASRIALGISAFYLLALTIASVTGVLALDKMTDTLKPYNFLLGPMQGLVASTLGVFFARRG